MTYAAAIAIPGLLGTAIMLEAFRLVRNIGDRWWQIHIIKRLGIGLLMLIGGQLLFIAFVGISESNRYTDLVLTALVFLVPPAFVFLGIREIIKGRDYNGAFMLFGGFGLTLVIVVQLLFG